MLEPPRLKSDDPASQMQKVENDEGNQQRSAPAHRPRGPARLDISFRGISDGSRSPAHASKLDRRYDMERHRNEQDDPYEPEQLSVAELRHTDFPKESGVRVDLVRSCEDLQIAEYVADHEADEDDAGDRHHDLLADHGVPEGDQAVTGNHALRRRVAVEGNRQTRILYVLHTNLNPFGVFIPSASSPAGKRGSTALQSPADEVLPQSSWAPHRPFALPGRLQSRSEQPPFADRLMQVVRMLRD